MLTFWNLLGQCGKHKNEHTYTHLLTHTKASDETQSTQFCEKLLSSKDPTCTCVWNRVRDYWHSHWLVTNTESLTWLWRRKESRLMSESLHLQNTQTPSQWVIIFCVCQTWFRIQTYYQKPESLHSIFTSFSSLLCFLKTWKFIKSDIVSASVPPVPSVSAIYRAQTCEIIPAIQNRHGVANYAN